METGGSGSKLPILAFDNQTNRYQRISPTGASIVEQTLRMIGGGFPSGSLDTMAWTAANSGAASAASAANGIVTLTSGTANSGYGTLTANTKARFLYASANLLRGTFRLTALGVADTTRSWGAFNFGTLPAIQDGFFFSYDGTTSTLSVNSASAGVITTVNSGSFNGEVKAYVADTNQHNFEIIYQVPQAFFFVNGVLLHRIAATNALLSSDMHLKTSSLSKNSASGTTSASLEIWASSIVRLGASEPSPQYLNIKALSTTVIKIGPGTLQSIIINTPGSNSNTVTIYDNTAASGTTIASINTSSTASATTLSYDVDFINGMTIVSAAGTAADITVVYD